MVNVTFVFPISYLFRWLPFRVFTLRINRKMERSTLELIIECNVINSYNNPFNSELTLEE